MSVQKAILPGLFIGIVCLIGLTSLISAKPVKGSPQEQRQAAAGSAAGKNASPDSCKINPAFPQEIRQWCTYIERYANQNGLDPNLVSAVMLQESAGNAEAYSKSGAVGLLQVMPSDGLAAGFMCPNGPCFADRPSSQQLLNPEFNIQYGTKMLSDLIAKYGDIREALKAYGPRDVGYYYADIILGIFNSHQ